MTPDMIDALVNLYRTMGRTDRQEILAFINMCEEQKRIEDLLSYFKGLLSDCEDDTEKELLVAKIESLETRRVQSAEWIAAMKAEWRHPYSSW